MPSLYKGFKFDGVHSSEYFDVNKIQPSILPTASPKHLTIPYRPGAYDFGRDIGIKTFEVQVTLIESSPENLYLLLREVAAWLNTDDPKEFVIDYEPDKTYKARLSGDTALDSLASFGTATLIFVAADPHAYGKERKDTFLVQDAEFSRDSTANGLNGREVAVNEPRWESGGILIEEKFTQLLMDSAWNDIETNWTAESGVSKAGLTNGRAMRLNGTASEGTSRVSIFQSVKVTEESIYTLQCDLRYVGSVEALALLIEWYDISGALISTDQLDVTDSLTDTLKTFSLTAEAPYQASTARVYPFYDGGQLTSCEIEATMPMFRKGKYPLKWHESGTKDSEVVTLGRGEVINDSEGTVELQFIPQLDSSEAAPQDRFHDLYLYTYQTGLIVGRQNNSFIFFVGDGTSHAEANRTVSYSTGDTLDIAVRWDGTKTEFFVNGENIATLPQFLAPNIKSICIGSRIGEEVSGTAGNALYRKMRISNIARTDEELAAPSYVLDKDTAAFIDFNEQSLAVQTQTVINNRGNTESYPVFRATFQKPSTSLALVRDDKYVLVGSLEDVEKTQVPPYTVKYMSETMRDTAGWTSGTYVDGGTVAGSMVSDGFVFLADDYGTGSSWHGPALIKSLPTTIQDFRVSTGLRLYSSSAKQIGRVEVYFLDVNGSVIGKVALKDMHVASETNHVEARVGDLQSGKYMISGYGKKKGYWNHFYGNFFFERKGDRFYARVTKYRRSNGKWYGDKKEEAIFYDKEGKFQQKLASIQVHVAKSGKYDAPSSLQVHDVAVYEINRVGSNEQPVIFQTGDVIEIDHDKGVVRKNGLVYMDELDYTSEFFELPKGETEVEVYPSDVANVSISHKDRWL